MYHIVSNIIATTPVPLVGLCRKTGKWVQPSMVSECKECVNKPDHFYCDGECMDKYDLNRACSLNSLVAKTESQCLKPCYQEGPPPSGGGCSDKYDCDYKQGEVCVMQKGRGKCLKM